MFLRGGRYLNAHYGSFSIVTAQKFTKLLKATFMKFCKIPKISVTRNIYKQPLNKKLNKQNIKTKTNLCSPKVYTVEFSIAIFGICCRHGKDVGISENGIHKDKSSTFQKNLKHI